VTEFFVDISRWQVTPTKQLDLFKVKEAGYSKVNIALTASRGIVSDPVWVKRYLTWALELDMDIACYHWLDGSLAGHLQAANSIQRMRDWFGDLSNVAHSVDCEDSTNPATWDIWSSYVDAMQQHLGRHVIAYSADWWWNRFAKNWPAGSALTPYLMAMPNDGPLTAYPGDDSPHWRAGYGGWEELSIMQWGVAPVAGVNASHSAIRDPAVWSVLSGQTPPPVKELDTTPIWIHFW
jgi:hypothetical protein